ncbi:MAG: Ppx/GppA family phosphatase [Alphaproteobacteria bacterium]|nr:MAG: Ppx/GppA family phosphatase [Alphaproteobacteria bacterium]
MSEMDSASAGKPSGEAASGSPGPRKRRRKRQRRSKGPRSKDQAATYNALENKVATADAPQTGAEDSRHGDADKRAKRSPGRRRAKKRAGATDNQQKQNQRNPNQRPGRWRHIYAALDLGTNNCRLLVARPVEDGFKVIDAFSRTVRLGEGLSSQGALSDEAMDRAIEALKVCAQKMQRRRVSRAHCIATEACRTAKNGLQFIARAEKETGLTFEIISTAQEACFAAAGCAPLLDRDCDKALVFDIGGGSTELIWLDLTPIREGKTDPDIIAWTSVPYGVVTLAEAYAQKANYNGRDEFDVYTDMVEEVRESILSFVEADPHKNDFEEGRAHLIGNSGTVTTLAAVQLGLRRYDRSRVDGVWIDSQDMRDLVDGLSRIGIEGRAENSCIGFDRADLLLPGCAILTAIQDTWPSGRMRVADRGLREGILLALMEKADMEEDHKGQRKRRRRGGRKNRKNRNTKPDAEAAQ